jgi:hypothetical protein
MSPLDNDLITCDVGELTYGLRNNVKDISDIWMRLPVRRVKFGERELQDIRESCLALQILIREIEKSKKREAA